MDSINNGIEASNQLIIEQLKRENELKTKWLYLIAHDFKGIFSSITLLLITYEDKEISQELFLSLLPELQKEAQINIKTLESTFAWVNAQVGGLKLQLEEVVVFHFFLDLKESFRKQLEIKNISLNFSGNQDLVINTDKLLLSFILKQVVDNAIKYSYTSGEIKMAVKSDYLGFQIAIEDKGLGMNQEVLDNLFTLDGSHFTGTMEENGAGLSLIIVKDFIEKLNAKISVISDVNKGTSVVFLFSK